MTKACTDTNIFGELIQGIDLRNEKKNHKKRRGANMNLEPRIPKNIDVYKSTNISEEKTVSSSNPVRFFIDHW